MTPSHIRRSYTKRDGTQVRSTRVQRVMTGLNTYQITSDSPKSLETYRKRLRGYDQTPIFVQNGHGYEIRKRRRIL